jgi:hypothetical protein
MEPAMGRPILTPGLHAPKDQYVPLGLFCFQSLSDFGITNFSNPKKQDNTSEKVLLNRMNRKVCLFFR